MRISALPRIANDIGLEERFLLWPASVYTLAAGCLLSIFGVVADVGPLEEPWNRRSIEDIDWAAPASSALLWVCCYTFSPRPHPHTTTIRDYKYRAPRYIDCLASCFSAVIELSGAASETSYHSEQALEKCPLYSDVLGCLFLLGITQHYRVFHNPTVSTPHPSAELFPRIDKGRVRSFCQLLTGYLIPRVKARTLAVLSAITTMIAPTLMATINMHETYWRATFWAILLSPVNPDGAFK